MLNQWRDKVEAVDTGDIILIHGRTVVVAGKPQKAVVTYRGEVHSAVEIVGIDVRTLSSFHGLAVPDQYVTIVR